MLRGVYPEKGSPAELEIFLTIALSLHSLGLYGHSAVYHEATDSLYVFGGFRFHVELAAPSPELYSLHCPDRTWSLLAPSQGAKVRKSPDRVVGCGLPTLPLFRVNSPLGFCFPYLPVLDLWLPWDIPYTPNLKKRVLD